MVLNEYKELIKENEKLTKEITQKEDECAKEGLSWEQMFEKTKDLRIKFTLNDRKARLIQEPSMQFGKKWNGKFYTLNEFINEVKKEFLTDDNGVGRYATETGVSDIYVYPSDIFDDIYRKDFSHVLWLNNN